MSAFQWALATACVWSIIPIMEKAGLAKAEPLVGLTLRCAGASLGTLVLFLSVPELTAKLRSMEWLPALLFVGAGFLGSVIGQFGFYHAMKLGEVSKVVPVASVFPALTFLIAVMVLGETFTLKKLIGILLVISGVNLLR